MFIRHRRRRDTDLCFWETARESLVYSENEGPRHLNDPVIRKSPTSRKEREKWGTLKFVMERPATRRPSD
jgi:hypothetical protein